TPPLEAGTKPMGFPPWSRGPLLHRGEKRQLAPLVEHGDSNPVFEITCLLLPLAKGDPEEN
ncbi:MAG: hypothetical protein V3T60_10070, partial [Candidatus Binatia bacterium]